AVYCAADKWRFPLTDQASGLYRRAVVKTSPAAQGQVRPKKLFHTPDQLPDPDKRCEGGQSGCREVSRFKWYFIYAEENGHYLVSSDANLGSNTAKLLGWLPKEDAIAWNTALGLRPNEALATRKGQPLTPDRPQEPEDYVCAYKTREALTG